MNDENDELFGYWQAIISCIKGIVDRRLAEERNECAKLARSMSDEIGEEISQAILRRGE